MDSDLMWELYDEQYGRWAVEDKEEIPEPEVDDDLP